MTGMSVFVTNMASMIGIGVAVDYSLFVLARYREEIAAGREPDDARAIALATSGVAVTFSGLTVIVSLAGLFIVDTMSVRSMALGAILVVAVSVLAATTLLPALIALLGPARLRAGPGRRHRLGVGAPAAAGARRARRPGASRILGALDRARSCAARCSPRVGAAGGPAGARRSPRCAAHPATARCASSRTDHETRVGLRGRRAKVDRRRAR